VWDLKVYTWWDLSPLLSSNPHYRPFLDATFPFAGAGQYGRNGVVHRALFQPKKWLQDEVDTFVEKHFADAYVVGAHVRAGHPMIVQTPKAMQRFWGCVKGLVAKGETSGKGSEGGGEGGGKGAKVFVSTNKMKYTTSIGSMADTKASLDSRIVTYTGPVTEAAEKFLHKPTESSSTGADVYVSKLAWIEMMVLSRTHDMVSVVPGYLHHKNSRSMLQHMT
jgi:hypothetical protein